MDSSTVQFSPNKFSNAEIVAKAIQILDAVENCGCSHCNQLLKGALKQQNEGVGFATTQNPDTRASAATTQRSNLNGNCD